MKDKDNTAERIAVLEQFVMFLMGEIQTLEKVLDIEVEKYNEVYKKHHKDFKEKYEILHTIYTNLYRQSIKEKK